MRRLALTAIATLALALAAVAPAVAATEPQTNLPDVADEVMCTVCGVLLDEAPDSPQAERERAFIRREINQGKTKDEIKDDLVDEYGTQVLAQPGTTGIDLAAWVVPAAALLLAGAGILIGLRRWRRANETFAALAAEEDDAEPPDQAERERLDADLARYDL
jgi:cytochrome c-type biogenesis protein CcmH/NrfF